MQAEVGLVLLAAQCSVGLWVKLIVSAAPSISALTPRSPLICNPSVEMASIWRGRGWEGDSPRLHPFFFPELSALREEKYNGRCSSSSSSFHELPAFYLLTRLVDSRRKHPYDLWCVNHANMMVAGGGGGGMDLTVHRLIILKHSTDAISHWLATNPLALKGFNPVRYSNCGATATHN